MTLFKRKDICAKVFLVLFLITFKEVEGTVQQFLAAKKGSRELANDRELFHYPNDRELFHYPNDRELFHYPNDRELANDRELFHYPNDRELDNVNEVIQDKNRELPRQEDYDLYHGGRELAGRRLQLI